MIYIPIADDETLSETVLNSLPDKYTLISGPRGEHKAASIWPNRVKIFNTFKGKYLRMQDSRVVHIKPDNFEVMEKFLEENPKWGGVALHTGKIVRGKLEKRHIHLHCVCIRREAVEAIKEENGLSCNCHTVADYIRKKWRYGYLEFNGGRVVSRMNYG